MPSPLSNPRKRSLTAIRTASASERPILASQAVPRYRSPPARTGHAPLGRSYSPGSSTSRLAAPSRTAIFTPRVIDAPPN